MIKPMMTAALAIILIACASAQQQKLSAKERVDNIASMCAENADAMKRRQNQESLYSRLGEREGIAAFSERLYAKHKANDKIGHLFDDVQKEPFVSNVTEFLVVNSGGDGEYQGGSMAEVHADLDISHEDFLVAGDDVKKVMKQMGAGKDEIQEATCFLVSFVPVVITE